MELICPDAVVPDASAQADGSDAAQAAEFWGAVPGCWGVAAAQRGALAASLVADGSAAVRAVFRGAAYCLKVAARVFHAGFLVDSHVAVDYWAVAAAEYSRGAAAFLLAGCFRAVLKHSTSAAHGYSAGPRVAAVRSGDWHSAPVRSGLCLFRADAHYGRPEDGSRNVHFPRQDGRLPTSERAPHPAREKLLISAWPLPADSRGSPKRGIHGCFWHSAVAASASA